jgi:hypothetical protein
MIYSIRILSGEADDFLLDIAIDGSLTFLALHQFIQEKLNFDPMQLASFFITDREWNKETEITLVDMMVEGQYEIHVMEKTLIEYFISDNKQRMLYIFDLFAERAFFMEVFNITDGSNPNPEVLNQTGLPPKQIALDLMDLSAGNFDDEFEMEEELDEYYQYDGELDENYSIHDSSDEDY